MRFDARDLAHAWLAVAQASSTDKEVAPLYKTVAIEEYTHGVRLIATDRWVLLTAWVSELGEHAPEPEPAELPDRTVVAQDVKGRGRGMLGFLLSLAAERASVNGGEYLDGDTQVELQFDVRVPAGQGVPETLDGLEPRFVVLNSPDVEKVYLPTAEVAYPDWRLTIDSFTGMRTAAVAMVPELLERVARVRKHAPGPLLVSLGGPEKPVRLEWPESDPFVSGVLITVAPKDSKSADPECTVCAEGAFCLRHAAGLVTTGSSGVRRDQQGNVVSVSFTSADAERLGKIADQLADEDFPPGGES